MKTLKLDWVTDPAGFPYYRISLSQTRVNFAKMDDVLEFIKRHMTVDTSVPLVKGAEKVEPTQQNKLSIEDLRNLIITLADSDHGVTIKEVEAYVEGKETYWRINQTFLGLAENRKLVSHGRTGEKGRRWYTPEKLPNVVSR